MRRPGERRRANLIDAHEPTVAGDIGRQYRDEPAFDPTLPWYGHGNVLSRLCYTETERDWGQKRVQVVWA